MAAVSSYLQNSRLVLLQNSQRQQANRHCQNTGSVLGNGNSSRGTNRRAAAGRRKGLVHPCIHGRYLLEESGSIVSHTRTFVNEENTTDYSHILFIFCLLCTNMCLRNQGKARQQGRKNLPAPGNCRTGRREFWTNRRFGDGKETGRPIDRCRQPAQVCQLFTTF